MDDELYRLHAEREETYWWWVAKNRIILRLIEKYGPASGRALDVGCGAGGVLAKLSEKYDAVGVDMSPEARAYCHARGLRAVHGSLPSGLPFAPERDGFDVIVMSEVIEHVHEDRESVAACAGLLNPGGVLVCTVPAHRWLWSSHDDFNHHVRRYTRRGFAALFEELGLQERVMSWYQCASMPLLMAARVGERLKVVMGGKAAEKASVQPLPGVINSVLRAGFECEKHVLGRAGLPWGTSVISVHVRSGTS